MARQVAIRPPSPLTIEDYRRDWEPQGWRLIIIGPTATWREEWGEWEAIRDIVQNALDEAESYTWGYDDKGLWIKDFGRGVQVADFLLGPPKLKPPHARGKFGEGMKIAALALVRKGYSVKVDTTNKEIWVVFYQVRVDGSADQLAALWRPVAGALGTRFHIIGYTGPAFQDRFAVNLPLDAILHKAISTVQTPIRRFDLLISTPPGRIYARDIYLKDIDSPFSYNLWGFEMAPDRHGPKSEHEMHQNMGTLWCTVTRVDLLEKLLAMVVSPPEQMTYETHNLNISHWTREPTTDKKYVDFIADNSWAWQQAWQNKFGESAVLRTEARMEPMVRHLGYKSVEVGYDVREALALAIKTDVALVMESQERLGGAQRIPDEKLSPRERDHLELARAMARKLPSSSVRGVYAAIIPPASDRARTAGMYSRETQEILISLEQLDRGRSTVDTLLHELAHHESGAEDLSREHSEQMTWLAARALEELAGGTWREELEKVKW